VKKISCPSCDNKYGQIALHWNRSDCEFPNFTEHQIEIMKGLLLGDADIQKSSGNCAFRIRSTNKDFLNWLDNELSPLSRGVKIEEDGESKKEVALKNELKGVTKDSTFKDLYSLRTVSTNETNELRSWYKSGKKRYPDNVSKKMLKYWYISDGWINGRYISIRCIDQSDDAEKVLSLIRDAGLEPTSFETDSGTIRISCSSSRDFLDSTKPVTGFEYKWSGLIRPQ